MKEDAHDIRLNFLKADVVDKQKEIDKQFEAKIVRMILKAGGVPDAQLKALSDTKSLTIDEMEQYNITIPIHIVSCKSLKQEMLGLFTDITKTKVWDEFFNIMDTVDIEEHEYIGLVFTSSGGVILVCHNWIFGDVPRGFTRLSRASSDGDQLIVIEPLEGFLQCITPLA